MVGWGRPAVRDDSVYSLSRAHEIVSLDKTTGAIRWRRPLPLANGEYSRVPMGSVVESTTDAVIVGDYDVLALDRRTGRLMWRFSPEDGYAPGLYLGVVTEDSVYTGSPGGRLHAIDLSNGRSRWSLSLEERHQTTVYQPIVDRGIVLAGYTVFERPTRGGVMAVEARTGIERWRAHFPEQPNNRSHVADAELNKLLVAQRREMDPARRRELVYEIQRYLAEKSYYVWLPMWPRYIAYPAYVKGFKQVDGYSLGSRLMHVWFER